MKAQTFLFAFLAAAALPGQNSDVGVLIGVSDATVKTAPGTKVGELRVSFQVNYARQLQESSAGRLYLELPVQVGIGTDGVLSRGGDDFDGRIGGIVFLTPGLRYHINVTNRFAIYAAGGFGAALSQNWTGTIVGNREQLRAEETRVSPAVNFGGGLDFRLTRMWSLRAEVRDFRATKESRIPGRRTVFQLGIGIHF